ncbi:hypothetical protein STRMA_0967 [Streptococcus macacae NCTC 11558]|uniref:Uncharacterized protein n=1 Tax=Streptococcus macacae NCTC 11558 TaxID=764298 RepID=G5JWJ5_9STRE|nr:hypothetical protein STRMA_0967 [Streptococcus macacae NCTC 11558]
MSLPFHNIFISFSHFAFFPAPVFLKSIIKSKINASLKWTKKLRTPFKS